MFEKIDRIVCRFIELNSLVAGVFVLIMMSFTSSDVILRFFARPIIGSHEITILILATIVFFAIPLGVVRDKHIKVDVLKIFPFADHITYFIYAAILFIVSWATIGSIMTAHRINITSQVLNLPRWPFMIVTCYGFFLTAVATVIVEIRLIRERKRIRLETTTKGDDAQ